jgi:Flp pilus assembly protein TadG
VPAKTQPRLSKIKAFCAALADTRATQIAEFAVALPLLLVMVVGIFDFGNAFNLKQKITTAAREAASMGASQPTSDLTNPTPPGPASVLAIRDLVSNSLLSSRMNDCGLSSAAANAAGGATPWKWSFTASCGAAGNLVLTVDRGYVFTSSVTAGGTAVKMISTNVTLLYPYKWQFDRVIRLLAPTYIYPGTTQITVSSVIENQS